MVATRASVACYPELNTNENCILCSDLDEMTNQIIDLYQKPEKITKLAQQARDTFNKHFTPENQVTNLKQFLKEII